MRAPEARVSGAAMTRTSALAAVFLLTTSLAATQLVACSCNEEHAATDAGTVAPAPSARTKPNVLIVLWDTTRADHLSLYGYDKPTTPNLDAFAKDATVYERATPVGMWTLPTHTAMFTGLGETEAGVHASWNWLDGRHETLAERLGAAGYETFAFSANIIVGPWTNLTQGFETLYTTYPKFKGQLQETEPRYVKASKAATAAKLVPEDASVELSPAFTGNMKDHWGKAVFKDAAPVAAQAFDDFLTELPSKDQPFFAYINMMEAHSPRVPSMESRKAVMSQEEIDLGLKTDSSLFALNEYIVGKRQYTDAEKAAIAGIYDASIRDLDTATQKIWDSLQSHGLLEDTVVIVVADHGEALGEHQRYEHRWSIHEELVHVPLVIRYPAKFEAKRVPERVSTADVFATVMELAGLQVPEDTRSKSLVGRTEYEPYIFAQLLDPFAQQLTSMSEAYPELVESGAIAEWQQSYCAAWEDQWKLIYASGSSPHMLFDLSADPKELNNLYDAEASAEQRAELEKAMYDFEAALADQRYDPNQRDKVERFRQALVDQMSARFGAAKEGGAAGEADPMTKMLEDLGYAAPDAAGLPWRDFCGPFALPPEERPEHLRELPAAPPPIENEHREDDLEQLEKAKSAKAGKAKGKAGKAKNKAKAGGAETDEGSE